MGSSLSPLDFLIGPGTQNPAPAVSAAQGPQVTPAQGTAPTAPTSPLAAIPGYNDAIAQQASGYLQDTMGKPKTPHDYMLEAMGIAPGQEDTKTKKNKLLHRLGIVGQVLAGRNFANEGQQKYLAAQAQMKQAADERTNQQRLGFEQANINRELAAPYIANDAELDRQKKLAQFQLNQGQQKLKMMEDMGLLEGMDPMQKAMLRSQVLTGVKLPSMGAMMRPVNQTGIKSDVFDKQFPGLLNSMGIDPKTTPLLDATFVNGKPVVISGKGIAQRIVPMWGGQAGAFNPYTSETSTLPNVAAPSTAGTAHNTASFMDSQGIQHNSSTTQKVPVGISSRLSAGPASPAPTIAPTPYNAAPNSVPPSAPNGLAQGVTRITHTGVPPESNGFIGKFDPTNNRIDHLVQMIGADSKNTTWLNGHPEKYKVERRMAELGIDPNNVTGSQRERAKNAQLILQHLGSINDLIDQADKQGELGVVANRWNDFLTNKLGKDETKDQIFSKLSSELGFLTTAAAMAHGGVRGGSSPQMLEHWEKTLEAKDPATLKSKLSALKEWMQGYSAMVPEPKDVKPANAPTKNVNNKDPLGIL